MYKDKVVGNLVAETPRDCGTMARLCDLSMPFQLCALPLRGEVRHSPEPSVRPSAAANSEKRQICTTCLFADSVGLCKDNDLMLSPIVQHTSVWEGVGARGRNLTWQPAVNHQSPAAKATNSDSTSCGRAEAQVKERIPEQRIKKGHSEYSGWTKIEKRNQINTKNYWK